MKPAIIICFWLVAACSPVPHRFSVDTGTASVPVVSAEASICGKPAKALPQSGTCFSGIVSNRCEGEGFVRLRFADGTNTYCNVGYVTMLDDRWDFVVRDRSCEPAATVSKLAPPPARSAPGCSPAPAPARRP